MTNSEKLKSACSAFLPSFATKLQLNPDKKTTQNMRLPQTNTHEGTLAFTHTYGINTFLTGYGVNLMFKHTLGKRS